MKRFLHVLLSILGMGFFVFFPVYSSTKLLFQRDLSTGDVGEDVRTLQIVLNKNTLTQVALTGPGSPGQETTVFGVLTKNAVERYQNLNKEEILVPLGLTQATGFVGLHTRAQLNKVSGDTETTSDVLESQVTIPRKSIFDIYDNRSTQQEKKEPVIYSISPTHGPDGTIVTVTGANFTPQNNTVLTSFTIINNISSPNGSTLQFKIEETFTKELNMPAFLRERWGAMDYNIYVTNINGESNSVFFRLDL